MKCSKKSSLGTHDKQAGLGRASTAAASLDFRRVQGASLFLVFRTSRKPLKTHGNKAEENLDTFCHNVFSCALCQLTSDRTQRAFTPHKPSDQGWFSHSTMSAHEKIYQVFLSGSFSPKCTLYCAVSFWISLTLSSQLFYHQPEIASPTCHWSTKCLSDIWQLLQDIPVSGKLWQCPPELLPLLGSLMLQVTLMELSSAKHFAEITRRLIQNATPLLGNKKGQETHQYAPELGVGDNSSNMSCKLSWYEALIKLFYK